MRRLNSYRLHDEEGATAVVVALSLIVLFGFGALAIDVGQIYQERRELQNGADAAVLAAAQDCADPATAATCVTTTLAGNCMVTTAALQSRIDEYANANANDGASSACVADLGPDHITVETETLSGGNGFLTHWLAGVIGTPTSTVTARATARWGVFGGGTTLPLTFSVCEWQDMVSFDAAGVPILPSAREVITFHTQTDKSDECIGPAGQDSPGGFGWLYPEDDKCQALVDADANVDGDTGNDTPSECDSTHLESLLGETVLVPIFGSVSGTGSNTVYEIIGFAGFVIDGYRFTGKPADYSRPFPGAPCKSPDVCISGVFASYTAYGDEIAPPGSNDFGATVVVLTE